MAVCAGLNSRHNSVIIQEFKMTCIIIPNPHPLQQQANCEWESVWGHHITLQSLNTTELSKVEMECLQRVSIGRLQGMEISVSYSILKGSNDCCYSLLFCFSLTVSLLLFDMFMLFLVLIFNVLSMLLLSSF